MNRKIITYLVPVKKDSNGLCTYFEDQKEALENPRIINLESRAEIARVAIDISQENTRAKKVAEAVMLNNTESTIELQYLI
jgi:hypothetical protein